MKIVGLYQQTKMLDSKNTNFASVFIYFRETQTAIGAFGVASKNSLYDMLLKEEFDNSDNMDRFFKNNYVDTFDDINSNSKNSSGRYFMLLQIYSFGVCRQRKRRHDCGFIVKMSSFTIH